jgi:hypothetical protein
LERAETPSDKPKFAATVVTRIFVAHGSSPISIRAKRIAHMITQPIMCSLPSVGRG